MSRAGTTQSWILILLSLVLVMASIGFTPQAQAAPGESDDPVGNPDLETACGLDILLILDESGSIDSSNAADDVIDAYKAFTQALKNTGSRMAVIEFAKQARLAIDTYTTVTTGSIASVFDPYIDNSYDPDGKTNWEDAMRAARYFLPRPSQLQPHLVVFITDGDPTAQIDWGDVTYDPGNPVQSQNEYELKIPLSDGEVSNANENAGADRAVANANAVKGDGSHILAIAVGNALQNSSSLNRLEKVSGGDVYDGNGTFDISTDDIFAVPNFEELQDALREAAFQLCSPSVTVQKLIDITPDPGTDDAFPGQGWEMTATVSNTGGFTWTLPNGAVGLSASQDTDGAGFATFQWDNNLKEASNVQITEEAPPGPITPPPDLFYDPSSTECTYRTPDTDGDLPLPHTGLPPFGFDIDVPADAIVTCVMFNRAPAEPEIDVEKHTNGVDADAPPDVIPPAGPPTNGVPVIPVGDPITWTYQVTNTGNVTLSGLTVTDDQGVTVTCPVTTLAPGDSTLCMANGTAVDTSGGAGYYENTGTAEATDPFGTVVNDDDPSHYVGIVPPTIRIEKATVTPTGGVFDTDAAPGPLVPVGEGVSFIYEVFNDGSIDLENVVVLDPVLAVGGGQVDCNGVTTVPAMGSITCVSDGSNADPINGVTDSTTTVVAGQYENLGAVVGNAVGDPTLLIDTDPSHHYGTDPSVSIEKWTNGFDADDPDPGVNPIPEIPTGDPVHWSYIVTNTGNVPITGYVVADDQGAIAACPRVILPPGASTICSATGTAVSTVGMNPPFDVYENVGSVTGNTPVRTNNDGSLATAPIPPDGDDSDPSHYIGLQPDLIIEKSTNGFDADLPPGPVISPGNPVTWEYEVSNVGNVEVIDVKVIDPILGLTPINCPQTTLDVGESMTCTANGTAVAGQYRNGGFVVGSQNDVQRLFDADPSHYLGASGRIDIEKWTNGVDADTPDEAPPLAIGEEVTWSYVVTNEANIPILNITVSDDQLGPIICPSTTLAAGEKMVCQANGTADQGLYENTAVVNGTDLTGGPQTDSDPSHYRGYEPGIDIEKYTNGQDADIPPGVQVGVGDSIVWQYVVTTNDLPIENVVVTDSRGLVPTFIGGDDGDGILEPGEEWIYEAYGIAEAIQYTNVATVDGWDSFNEEPVTDSDPSNYQGTIPVTGGGFGLFPLALGLLLMGVAALMGSRRRT